MLIHQYAEVVNYNLMWRNSNNTSGWPDNLKSDQIVRETPTLDVIIWIPPPGFYFLPYKSLHEAIQYAVSASVRSRRTNRMPYPDIWNRARLFTCCFIFAASRISRIWNLSLSLFEFEFLSQFEFVWLNRPSQAKCVASVTNCCLRLETAIGNSNGAH